MSHGRSGMRTRIGPRRFLAATVAAVAVVALASVSAAEPAAGRPSASLGLVTTRDVAGLRTAATPGGARRTWSALLPASARSGAAVRLLRGPRVVLVSRAAFAQTPSQAAAVARTLRRLSTTRLTALDTSADGRTSSARGRAHAGTPAHAFSGNLCAAASAAALWDLKLTVPCVSLKASLRAQSTPLGPVQNVLYRARWGYAQSVINPKPYLLVQAIHVQGSAAAVAYLQKAFRAEVLKNGTLFSTRPWASESGDTISCDNPPTHDCTQAEIDALVGRYGLTMEYFAPAVFIAEDDPQHPGVNEANDRAQEEAIKGPFVGLAHALIAALSKVP